MHPEYKTMACLKMRPPEFSGVPLVSLQTSLEKGTLKTRRAPCPEVFGGDGVASTMEHAGLPFDGTCHSRIRFSWQVRILIETDCQEIWLDPNYPTKRGRHSPTMISGGNAPMFMFMLMFGSNFL